MNNTRIFKGVRGRVYQNVTQVFLYYTIFQCDGRASLFSFLIDSFHHNQQFYLFVIRFLYYLIIAKFRAFPYIQGAPKVTPHCQKKIIIPQNFLLLFFFLTMRRDFWRYKGHGYKENSKVSPI